MAGRAQLRASDLDRDRVADRLRNAAAEGRLATDELELRVESALRARTYAQLDRLVEDLPGRSLARRPRRRLVTLTAHLVVLAVLLVTLATVVALLAGVVAAWWLWLAAAWLLFGRGRRTRRLPRGDYVPARHRRYGHWA